MQNNFRKISILLLVDCVAICFAQTPRLRITDPRPPYGHMLANDRSSITCRVINRVDQAVEWHFKPYNQNGTSILLSYNENIMFPHLYVIDHPSNSPESWRLTIKSVKPEDGGQYVCRVWTSGHSDIKDTIEMQYADRPQIDYLNSAQSVTVKESESVNMQCIAHGVPQVTTIWQRLGGSLIPDKGPTLTGKILHIPSVKPEHRGNYTCLAKNSVGSAILHVSLVVQFNPVVKGEWDEYKQKIGHDVQLTCMIESNPMVEERHVIWTRGRENLTPNERFEVSFFRGANYYVTSRLYIKRVTKDDFGQYVCSAESPTGDGPTKYVDILLSESSVELPIGAPVQSSMRHTGVVSPVLAASITYLLFI